MNWLRRAGAVYLVRGERKPSNSRQIKENQHRWETQQISQRTWLIFEIFQQLVKIWTLNVAGKLVSSTAARTYRRGSALTDVSFTCRGLQAPLHLPLLGALLPPSSPFYNFLLSVSYSSSITSRRSVLNAQRAPVG